MEKEFDVPFDVTEKKTPYMTLTEAESDWKKWADLKNKTVSGKDIAVLMGHTPWDTKEGLLAEKLKFVSRAPEKGSKEAEIMKRGLDLRDEAKNRFIQSTGIAIGEGAIYRDTDSSFMIARIQFQCEKDGCPVQILTTGAENARLWKDGIPQNVVDEAQWNMALTGTKNAYIGCLIDERDNPEKEEPEKLRFVSASIERDDAYIRRMTKAAERFQKEMENKFLHISVAAENVELVGQAFHVTTPTDSALKGDVVVIPQKMAQYDKKREDCYRLNLPIHNLAGKSFLFKRIGDGRPQSVSSGEIYCAFNKVRGRTLFANNRPSLRQYYQKKADAQELDKIM